MIGAAFTGLILSYLISLAAHISFHRRISSEEIAALPLRSPLGICGSIVGFIMMAIVLIQTWFHPIVNLWSGLACLILLTFAFLLAKFHQR
jgi:L-asparagine transporter-like permease